MKKATQNLKSLKISDRWEEIFTLILWVIRLLEHKRRWGAIKTRNFFNGGERFC